MSDFSVPVSKIASINNHPKADRLMIAKIEGWDYEFAVAKDTDWKVGDLCVYVPIESVLPDELIEAMQLGNSLAKYNGKRNVVETKELPSRSGFYSQGLIWDLAVVAEEYLKVNAFDFISNVGVGDDLASLLEITKLEKIEFADEVKTERFSLSTPAPFPQFIRKYDIEDAQKHPELLRVMTRNGLCVITEKVEGSNCWLSKDKYGNIVVGQRSGITTKATEFGKLWWEAVTRDFQFLVDAVFDDYASVPGFERVTVRGEIIGERIAGGAPKNNYYGISGMRCYAFDIEVNGVPLDASDFLDYVHTTQSNYAPVIVVNYIDKILDGQTLPEFSNGQSMINPDVLREGIVIRPLSKEMNIPRIGRFILKCVSPQYLASKKGK